MADGSMIFPIGFDLEKGIKDAGDDWDKKYAERLEKIITKRPIAIKTELAGFDELGKSIDALNENFTKLTAMINAYGNNATTAQQAVTNSVEEHGQAVANTTNTIQRQLMIQERVNKGLRESYTEQERIKNLLEQYHDTYEGQVSSLVKLNRQISENKKAQSENDKALKSGSVTLSEYSARQVELVSEQRQLAQQKSELSQIMKAEEKAMLAQEGSYDSLSQQLSLLKRAYKELNEEGRTSPFGKELESAIQNLDANLKDMAADMGEFQRNVGNYAIAGQNGIVTTESLTAAINREAITTQDLIDQTRILEEAKRLLDTSDANYASTLETINAKLEENKRIQSDVSDILGKGANSVAEAEAQNRRLSEAIKHVDLTSADAKKKLEEIRAQIDRNNKVIADATGANEKYAESILGLVGVNANFGSSLQSLGNSGNFIDGLKTKVQALGKTLMGLLSNPMALAFLGIAGVAAGFKWWYDYNKGLIEASRLTENFTGLSGKAADKVTADMQMLADHMGQGYDKTITAANALVQQFGISWSEAIKLMQDGIAAGADMSGNMVGNIERFAPALRDAGVSADEFMSILADTRNGIFNEDGVQMIVRAGGRLKAMTKQMADALDAVGISSKQLQKDLTDGTTTMFDAVQMVATKIKELPENSQEAGNIMKTVFGRTASEGGSLLIQSIADVNTNLDIAKERMGELGKANEEQMNAQKELNEALSAVFKMGGSSFEVMLINAKTFIAKGLTKIVKGCVDIVNWIVRMYNKSFVVRGAVNGIVAGFNNLKEVARYVLNQIIDSFKAAGTVLEGIVTLDWDKIKQGWSDGMKALNNNASTLAKNIASNTTNAFKKMLKDEMKEVSIKLDDDNATASTNKNNNSSNETKKLLPQAGIDKEAAKTYLQTLNKIEQSITSINNKYAELAKKEGNTKAIEHINELYKTQLDYINELGRQFGLSFKIPTSFKDLQSYRTAILGVIKKLKASGIKGADNAALELEMKIGLGNVDNQSKQIETELKRLSDKISRTKTAQEFYDRILSTTGDYNLAATISMSIYGNTGDELQAQMAEQIQKMFSGYDIEVPVSVIGTDNQIDYLELEKFVESMQKELGGVESKTYQELIKIAQAGQKNLAKTYDGYLKDLEKAKSYSDKRIELARYTAKQIAEIEASKLPQEEKKRLIAGYKEREDKEAAKIEYDAFKDSALYVQMFEDLDYASTSALTRMRDRLIALKEQWKNLDPTQLKELQSRLKEIDAQIAARNPFKALADAFKKYRDLRKSGRTKSGDELNAENAEKARKAAEAKMLADERAYQAAREAAKVASEEEKPALEEAAEAARQVADASKEAYDAAERIANEAANAANEWKGVGDGIGNANQEIDKYQSKINEALDGVRKMLVEFGASDEDVQFFDDIVSGLNEIVDAGQQAATSVAAFMTGDIFTGITSAISAIGGLVSGFSTLAHANAIRKANKEIEKQAQLLERLEYTYSRLDKAAEKVFGKEYLANYRQQLDVLNAQAKAYQKQAEAEKSKGKKADKEKLKEYENAARDTMDKIADMQGSLAEKFLGTDLTSAARDFARAWLDSWKVFDNTADKMSEKFREMLENMIVESMLARVMQRALEPVFKMIDEMEDADFDDPNFWRKVMTEAEKGATAADKSGKIIMQWAKDHMGFDPRGETSGGLKGISRDIASASEEQITGLAATMNTWSYYVSFVPNISSDVAAMRQILERDITSPIASPAGEWTDWQQQAMDNYIAIQRNTADTVVECRRIAASCAEEVNLLKRVITNNPSSTAYGVKVFA